MKNSILRIGYLLVFVLVSSVAAAAVTTTPASLTIARGTQTVRLIRYNFDLNIEIPPILVSPEGLFISGQTVLGRVRNTISPTMRPKPNAAFEWIGTASEQLVIPETVVRRAEELGLSRFQYQRTFSTPDAVFIETAVVSIAVTTAGGGPLQITGIRLYFENNLGNITIQRNEDRLIAHADLYYKGTGYLRAFWQVDGRILSYVNRFLTSGNHLTLTTPTIPALPTFREGSHTVRLIIQQPDQDIPFPKAIYYVTADPAASLVAILLAEPAAGAVADFAPFRVIWNPAADAATYLVEFFLKDEDRPMFSAYVADGSAYAVPEPALRHYFAPGNDYGWQVKGFDRENNLVGESERRAFRLQ